jgi:hypothetical protein
MNNCMLRKRKSQLSITMIIGAVIGLIIIVVIVLMLTGKLGGFSEGARTAGNCNAVCKAAGYGTATGTVVHPGLIDSEGTACTCDI